jgi:hypothetical protein
MQSKHYPPNDKFMRGNIHLRKFVPNYLLPIVSNQKKRKSIKHYAKSCSNKKLSLRHYIKQI